MVRVRISALLLALAGGCGRAEESPEAGKGPGVTAPADGPTAKVEVLPGALDDGAKVVVERVASAAPYRDPGETLVGPVWKLRVEGHATQAFRYAIPVGLPYDPEAVPRGETVRVSRWEEGRWAPVPDSEADALTGVVTASVDRFSVFAPTSARGIRTVGRWRGTSRRVERYGTAEEPLLWSRTPYTLTHTLTWELREETHASLSWRRVVAEKATWSVHETKHEWRGGKRGGPLADRLWPSHDELRLEKTYVEADLNRPMPTEDREKVEAARRQLEAILPRLEDLARRFRAATVGSDQARQLRDEHERLEGERKGLEHSIATLEFAVRPRRVFPEVDHEKHDETGERTVTVGASVDPHDESGDFKYTRIGLFGPPLAYDGKVPDPVQAEEKSERAFFFKSPKITRPWGTGPHGPVLREVVPIADGEETHEYTGSTASPSSKPLVVRGTVYHRIRAPRDDADENWVHAQEPLGWEVLAPLVIPPSGRVSVELSQVDPATNQPRAPPVTTVTGADGAFELRLPDPKDSKLTLKVVYQSAAARLREECQIEIPGSAISAGRDASSDAPQDVSLSHVARAFLRYAGQETEFPLGTDPRTARLSAIADGVVLDLTEKGSIWLSTFVYMASHANQNLAEVTIRGVAVPWGSIAKAISGATPARPDALLQEAEARVGPTHATTVDVRGTEVCFPSSTLMMLDALGLETATEPGIGRLAQEIYDRLPRPASLVEVQHLPRGYVWYFPFDDDAVLDWFVDWFVPVDPVLQRPPPQSPFSTLWPFVEVPPDGAQKKWLITVKNTADGRTWRPWQVTDFVFPLLEDRHPGRLSMVSEGIDIFAAKHAPKVIRHLGLGGVATVSISHLSQPRAERGTHVLVLLGAVLASDGSLVRHIFHDPYGDLTRTPDKEGYYRPFDTDNVGHEGRYVPYGNRSKVVKAWKGTIAGNYWNMYRPKDRPDIAGIRARLLPGD